MGCLIPVLSLKQQPTLPIVSGQLRAYAVLRVGDFRLGTDMYDSDNGVAPEHRTMARPDY